MTEFRSWQSYERFASSVTRKARYFYDKDVTEFLETVIATTESRKKNVPQGTPYWRAQIGYNLEWHEPPYQNLPVLAPFSSERMYPRPNAATEGRVNPKGLPYLYVATDPETAVSEVRPWVGKYVSVAKFETAKALSLIDCSSAKVFDDYVFYSEEPDAATREKVVWEQIDRSFSEPFNPADSTADYVPTQVLAEYFRINGFDGIAYKSHLGPGLNVALFDINTANVIERALRRVDEVSFVSKEISAP
jgi:RES domain-containing protein